MTDHTEVRIDIAAPPAQVFHALTTSRDLEQWFAEHADVDVEAGRFDFWGRFTPGLPSAAEASHKIIGHRPDELVAFEWVVGDLLTHITFTLRPTATGTDISVRRDALPKPGQEASEFPDFWCLLLQNLRSYLEDGAVAWRPDFSLHPKGEVRLVMDCAASPETVFAGLIEPAQIDRWMGAGATVDPVPGGTYDMGWQEEWGRPLVILDIDAPNRLSYSWSDPSFAGTIVTWELEGSAGATRITLVHSGFGEVEPGEYLFGWADFLVRLKWMSEKGAGWMQPEVVAASYV